MSLIQTGKYAVVYRCHIDMWAGDVKEYYREPAEEWHITNPPELFPERLLEPAG